MVNANKEKNHTLFLYAGFAFLLITFVFLATYCFHQIVETNERLSLSVDNNDAQLRAAMLMRVAVRERAILLWHMSLQPDIFERDELVQRFYLFASKFASARQNYRSFNLNMREKDLFAQLEKETNNRAPVLRDLAEMLLQGADNISYIDALDKTLSEQIVVTDILDNIIRLQQRKNEIAQKRSANETSKIFKKLIIGISLIIITGVIFARSVINVTTNQLSSLIEAKEALTKQGISLSRANEQLKQMARYDHLTGLANRRMLSEHMQKTMALASRQKKTGAMLYIDLDGFKLINDNYGHAVGDAYLKLISEQMDALLRVSDMLARLGGDEFIVVLFEVKSEEEVVVVAEKLLSLLSQEYTVDGNVISASASIGISYFTGKEESMDEVFNSADIAMYKAKQDGKNKYFL